MTRARGWLLILVLLTPAVVLPLCVPLFDRDEPRAAGFPLFFWIQFVFIALAVVATAAAYVIGNRVARLDRVAHGLPATPPTTGSSRGTHRGTRGGSGAR